MEDSEDYSPLKTEQARLCHTWDILTDLASEYTRQGPGSSYSKTSFVLRGEL